jgi:hypothetical protein
MKRLVPITAVLLALAVPAALASVAIYGNSFKSRSGVTEIKKFGGGKKCGKSWKGKKALGVVARGGNRDCGYRTPVEGDRNQPNHTIVASGKVLKRTDGKIRDRVYNGVALRANRKTHYELRIFSKGRKWRLLKSGQAVERGTDNSINPVGKKNTLRLSAEGRNVTVRVNGKQLASFRDGSPEEVSGRKTVLTFGSTAKRKTAAHGLFDRVRVLIPSP